MKQHALLLDKPKPIYTKLLLNLDCLVKKVTKESGKINGVLTNYIIAMITNL